MGNDDALLAGLQELEALDMEDQLLATPVVALRAVPSGKLQQLLATRAVALPAVPSGNLPEVKNATAVIPVSPVPVSACELFPLTGNAPVTMNCQPESAKVKVTDREKQEKRRKQNVERVRRHRLKKREKENRVFLENYLQTHGSKTTATALLPPEQKEEYETIFENEYGEGLFHEIYEAMGGRKNPKRSCSGKCTCHTVSTCCDETCRNRARELCSSMPGYVVCNINNCGFGEKDCGNRIEAATYLTSCAPQHLAQVNGKGLIATEMIPEGAIIGQYVGVVMKKQKWRELDKKHNSAFGAELIVRGEELVVDARQKGNILRYVNHGCKPSCTLIQRRVNGVETVWMKASHKIEAGKPLEICYGSEYIKFLPESGCCCSFCSSDDGVGKLGEVIGGI